MNAIDDMTCPLDALCDAIVERYHVPLHRALPRLRDELAQLSAAHNNHDLNMVRDAFAGLADQIEAHLSKEDHLLFPAVIGIAIAEREHRPRPPSPFVTVLHPIRMMEAEHARIEAGLDLLSQLASEVAVPAATMPAWQQCMAALSELDRDLRAHHRTENEVLFPRALETERRLP